MFKCAVCGHYFTPERVGHVDDHIEICKGCMPKFTEIINNQPVSTIQKSA